MIIAHLDAEYLTPYEITEANKDFLKSAIWIDMLSPTREEEQLVESMVRLDIPTRDEMVEIELSRRLHTSNDILFMTVAVISHSTSPEPRLDPISFVLSPKQLVTVRYVAPTTFSIFKTQLQNTADPNLTAASLFVELLDANIDRLADILEIIARNLDDYSKMIFITKNEQNQKIDYAACMQQIGLNGDLNTKIRESLLSFFRLLTFFQTPANSLLDEKYLVRVSTLHKDVAALSDHANFLANKITFLLDATLGMVNIEQNNIIKIFSVAAVIFLPPTLIASLYGMNFKFMPELHWRWGYPVAVTLMLISAYIPYRYFKNKKWL